MTPLFDRMSRLGFGAASIGNLGRKVTAADACDAVEAALAAGIRYFDTAPFYGLGLSERRLGDVLRGVPDVVVSTKVGRLLKPDLVADTATMRDGYATGMPFSAVYDYSYDGVMRSHEASLHRLGLARVDILYAHDIGRRTHGDAAMEHWRDFVEGGVRALDELRAGGAVNAVGLGVNEWQVCVEAMLVGRFDVFMLAGRYTLLDQGALRDFMPAAAAHGARVVMAGVYNSGILATGSVGRPMFDYLPASAGIIARTLSIESVCRRFGVSLPAAALQFAMAHPLTVSVVPGLASAARVTATRMLMDEIIPAAFWASLRAEGLIDPEAPT